MLGVKRKEVLLAPHDADWAAEFERVKAELCAVLMDNAVAIHHVGSTAIRGISAKPILDVAVVVEDSDRINYDGMEKARYEYRGEQGVPGRYLFVRRSIEGLSTHHVHMYLPGNDNCESTLLFCRYLNEHPDWAQRYNDLKHALAKQYPTDRAKYTEGKAAFIQQVIALAKEA